MIPLSGVLAHVLAAGPAARPAAPPVLSLRGASNSGKTRLVEQLTAELTRRRWRVGTVKHASHEPTLDIDGKDSHRHAAAGAERVLLLGPSRAALFVHRAAEPELAPWLDSFAGAVDIVLVEGFKQTPLPYVRIELGESFTLTRERHDGHPGWRLTRPAGEGPLHYPDTVIATLVEFAVTLMAGDADGRPEVP